MCRVVLRPYSHACGFGCLRTLGKSTDMERSNRETERQNQSNAGSNDAFVPHSVFSQLDDHLIRFGYLGR